jgi:hypothetical protein
MKVEGDVPALIIVVAVIIFTSPVTLSLIIWAGCGFPTHLW